MEMYTVSEAPSNEIYMIQGMDPNMQFTAPFEQVDAMYNEGAPEYVIDQGLYYPSAANYGFYNYCTGFESPSEWEDQQRVFGVDGPNIQYLGAQNESMPYVYYTPGYGYTQTPYNPYNPYIPGAVIGADGQQYYTISPYQDSLSSPAYVPFVVEPDVIPNSSSDSLYDTGASFNRTGGRGHKYNINSASGAFPNTPKTSSNQISPLTRLLERPRGNDGPSKQAVTHGSVSSGCFPNPAIQSRSASGSVADVDNLSNGKVLPHYNQLKAAIPVGNGLSDFGSGAQGRNSLAKIRPKFQVGRALNDIHGNIEPLSEQNCGPRINRSKNQLSVKAYTTKAGDSNAQGNIIIRTDQYNKDNFPVDYVHAKFFVIKSYSEDDVHKSVKYNVWSSTPHGNKKLSSAYEDAQRIAAGNPGGCPIFLFFSVNASGQFCGVAEMVGQVDFNKDMDFWQQDKWSGSFPVIWHILKDVPNTSVRHIVLENNENKPVSNSRDTQEIIFKKGLEMLKIFKHQSMRTSLLDDFMYYEDRQKIMQDERGRYLVRKFESPFLVTTMGPPRKLNPVRELPHSKENKDTKSNDANNSPKSVVSASEQIPSSSNVKDPSISIENSEKKAPEAKDDAVSSLKMGSLTINPKLVEVDSSAGVATATPKKVDIVNVGTIPVRVVGFAEALGNLKVGTIPLDPRALKLEKGGSPN